MDTPHDSDDRIDWRSVVQLGLGIAAGIVAAVGTLAVVTTSFSLSFDAITAVARAASVRGSLAWQMPVAVDGAMLVATITAVVMHRMKRNVVYPWVVVMSGVIISILCNAAHATGMEGQPLRLSPAARMGVSAIPAVMLALSVHLLITLIQSFFEMASAVRQSEQQPRSSAPTGEPTSAASPKLGVDPSLDAPPVLTGPQPERSLPPVPVTPSVVRTVKRPAARKRPARTRAQSVKLEALGDAELRSKFTGDFGIEGPPSANQVRIRYGIGADRAGEAYERWKTLSGEGSPERQDPPSEAAEGASQ